jgi:hypothetical protein
MKPTRRVLAILCAAVLALAATRASAVWPSYVAVTGAANPFAGIDPGGFVAPALADLDGDGDLDFVAGEQAGAFFYFENVGTLQSAVFMQQTGAANPLDGVTLVGYSWPALVDLDGDGDFDLVAGQHATTPGSGLFRYFENVGTPQSAVFVERTGAANPLDGFTAGNLPAPAFADLDDDGDFDLVAGTDDGTFYYFENTGSALSPAFTARTGAANPLDGQDVGNFSTAAFADADGDGDFDFLSGLPSGGFAWFENTGTAASPVFTLQSGDASPLFGLAGDAFSTATFADLDGNGLPDVVAGAGDGKFFFFAAPEASAGVSAFAAFAAIALLARGRARRALG